VGGETSLSNSPPRAGGKRVSVSFSAMDGPAPTRDSCSSASAGSSSSDAPYQTLACAGSILPGAKPPPNVVPMKRQGTGPMNPSTLKHTDTNLSLGSESFNSTQDSIKRAETRSETRGNLREDSTSCCRSSSASFAGGQLNERSRILKSQHTVNHLLAMKSERGADDPVVFRKEVEDVRARVRSLGKRTLNPSSRYMRIWDIIVICALLVTAIITPFEVGFYEATLYAGPFNFAFNRIIDAIFIVDIVVAFFTPVRAPPQKGGMMIYDNKAIAIAYLRGWFFLDFFTCIPFEFIIAGIAAASGNEIDLGLLRLLRVFRILKLMRIVRASRIINRWQDHIGLSFASMSLIQFTCLTCVLAHWLACLWGFQGIRSEAEWHNYGQGLTWIQKANISNSANEYELYAISLYVALNNIFGGSCEINPGTYNEFFVQGLMLLLGSSVWAYVIGSACGIIATLDPARVEFRQTMDELNYFCRDHLMPSELTVKLRAYFRNTIHIVRSRRYEALLQKMSVRLRGDAAYRMCEYHLRTVPFLVSPDLEPEFMCNLAIKYRTCVYSRLERVPCTDLFIVERGVVAKKGHLGLAGTCFGKDVILSNDNLRDIGDAIALTFVQTISLTQSDIFDLLPDYPKAFYTVRKAALRMALIRALVKAAGIIKRGGSKFMTGQMSIVQIFDLAMREAAESREEENKAKNDAKSKPIPLSLASAAKHLKGGAGSFKKQMAEGTVKPKGKWGVIGKRCTDGGLNRLSAASCSTAVGGATADKVGASRVGKCEVELAVSSPTKELRQNMTVEEEVKVLNSRVGEQQKKMEANHSNVMERLSTLERSMADFLGTMNSKLDAVPRPVIKQKRMNRNGTAISRPGRINGNGSTPPPLPDGAAPSSSSSSAAAAVNGEANADLAANGGAASTTLTPVEEARLAERRELREEASNGNLPSHSSPFEA